MMYLVALAALNLVLANNLSQYVTPLLGDSGGGNTFPGVTRPWGIVKIGPDEYSGHDAYSGFLSNGVFTGFSLTHESGTGGAPKYGVVSQMPWSAQIDNPLANLTANRTQPDQASVGYYLATLDNGISVELAATARSGILRYNWTSGDARSVVMDMSHVLPSFRGQGLGQWYAGGGIEVFEDGHYEANGSYNNGWNRCRPPEGLRLMKAPDWTIYACGHFNQMPNASIFTAKSDNVSLASYGSASSANGTERLGAVFSFLPNTTSIESRIGVSFISSQQACQNLKAEAPWSHSFESIVTKTASLWEDEVLSKVSLINVTESQKSEFYSMMYGAFIIPTNKTGENPLWNSGEPYYDDTFTLWDLNRCSTALWHVLHPTFYEEYVRSLIDIWRNEGYMPDARSSFFNGRTQGGSNADNVLADAFVKGVRGKVNWTDGYAAMVKDAEVTPVNNFDPMANDSSTKEGRGALPDWKEYGFITPRFSRAVSRAVGYSVNDFSLHQVALGLNNTEDASKYLNRSAQWRNHWNHDAISYGFNGFVVPRVANGTFLPQNPLSCGGCYWSDAYYEATPWEYSLGMIHDVATLVNYSGGPDTFRRRLDTFFAPGMNPANYTGTSQFNYTLNNPSNEPDFAAPSLYHFVGRQDLGVQAARYIAETFYWGNSTGLPGNSDAGAMQTWWLWNAIGLYPFTGQTTFLIHSPRYSMDLNLGEGKTLRIRLHGEETGAQVQRLEVNGKDWKKNWLVFDDVFNGGTMEFWLGANASDWFSGGELPPSPGAAGVPPFNPSA